MKQLLTILFTLSLLVILIKTKTSEYIEKTNLIAYEIWQPNSNFVCYNDIPPSIKNLEFDEYLNDFFKRKEFNIIIDKDKDKKKTNRTIKKIRRQNEKDKKKNKNK